MRQQLSRAGRGLGLHVRRQVVGYVALAVALGGTAYAGGKASSGKVGAKDLRSMVTRSSEVTIQPHRPGSSTVECERGEQAIAPSGGGGVAESGPVVLQGITPLLKNGKAKGFTVHGFNSSSQPQGFAAQVTCLRP